MKKENIARISVVFAFVVLFTVFKLVRNNKDYQLRRNMTTTTGTIYKTTTYRGGKSFSYRYFVKSKEYDKTEAVGGFVNCDSFISRSFPVIYDSVDINSCYILLLPKDFKKFSLSFPDSLKWVIDHYQPILGSPY